MSPSSSPSHAIRIGIVGTGYMAKAHTLAYNNLASLYWPELPAMDKRRMAGITKELAEDGAAQWRWSEATGDWRHVTRADDIDVVDICTPNHAHAEIAIDAIKHGKDVLCEKPLAHNLADATSMYEAAATSGVVHQVGFIYRAWPAVRFARQLIEEGAIGQIMHSHFRFHQDYALDRALPVGWRFRRKESGGGSFGDVGSHCIDLARYLIGDITRLVARERTFINQRPVARETASATFQSTEAALDHEQPVTVDVDVDDVTDVLCEFEGGAIGTIQTNWTAAGHKLDLGFEVGGDRGALRFSWEHPNELQVYSVADPSDRRGFRTVITGPMHPGGEPFWGVPGQGFGYVDAMLIAYHDLVARVIDRQPAAPDFLDGLRACEIVDAAARSSLESCWVNVGRHPAIGK